MAENIYASGGDLEIKYVLKVGDVIAPIGSLPFILRYYNPNDETKYVEASFDGTTYKNIKPKSDHYIIAIKNVDLEPGRMFCWERIDNASANFTDGKRKDSSRYDVGKIVKVFLGTQNLNTQTNFLQGVWFDYESLFVNVLPLVGIANVIYFIPSGNNSNLYLYSQGAWRLVGTTSISLADFCTKAEINSLLSNYVLKVAGAGLITDLERLRLTNAIDVTDLNVTLLDYVKANEGQRLITSEEAAKLYNAVTNSSLEKQLAWYVPKVTGERMINEDDINKIENAIDLSTLDTALAKMVETDTKEVPLVDKDYTNIVLYASDEGEERSKQVKISIPSLLKEIQTTIVYPTYKTLEGIQNGSNNQFKYRGTLIQETAELYIDALIYPVNIGFTFEDDTIVITGAPIPKAEDIMRLKAIYLT